MHYGKNATVTVGLPVHNGAATLRRSIASLEALTFDGLTFLVADDASNDDSAAILCDWAARDHRVRLVQHAQNLGPVANFEWLAAHADTAFFMYAAQDDAWSPNYVSTLHSALVADEGADLAVSQIVLMSENFDAERRRILYRPSNTTDPRALRARRLLRQAASGWYYGLYRRQALLRALNATRRFGNAWGHDFITLLPFLIEARVTGTNEAVFFKRVSEYSESRFMPVTAADQWKAYRQFFDECSSALSVSSLSLLEKIYLGPFLPKYVGRHSKKLGRILRKAFEEKITSGRPASLRQPCKSLKPEISTNAPDRQPPLFNPNDARAPIGHALDAAE